MVQKYNIPVDGHVPNFRDLVTASLAIFLCSFSKIRSLEWDFTNHLFAPFHECDVGCYNGVLK